MKLKQIFRIIFKRKTYSFLNIAGLAVGIACASFIFLWAEDEFSYDKHFEKYHQVHMVMENQTYDGKIYTFYSTPGPLSDALKSEVPGIKDAARVSWGQWQLLSAANDKDLYENIHYADPSVFSIFSLSFVSGDPGSAFSQPQSMVISEKLAGRIFGDEDPVGKTLKIDHADEYLVTAVIRDVPANSTQRFECLVPWQAYENRNTWLRDWGNNALQTFVELEPTVDVATMNAQLENFLQAKDPELLSRLFLFGMDQWRLYTKFENGKQVGGPINNVRMFIVIAWIILAIACINFMNLATARSSKRALEVGVRKAIGARKGILVQQFMSESLITSFLAVGFALIIMALLLPSFNTLVEKELTLGLLQPIHLAAIIAIGLLCGLFAGSYPAFYLSSFNPILVLKGLKTRTGRGSLFVRKGLVVFQFGISVVLIICSIVVYMQISHAKNRELGFDKEHLVRTGIQGEMRSHIHTIQQELANTGLVEQSALSNQTVLNIRNSAHSFFWKGKDESKQILIHLIWAGPKLIETMGMQLEDGRDFRDGDTNDRQAAIINQRLASLMGDEGRVGGTFVRNDIQYEIVGIVKDFVYNNMYSSPAPMLIFGDPEAESAGMMLMRLKPTDDLQKSLAQIESIIKPYSAGYPFEYYFYDEEFTRFFSSELLIGKLASLFATLAIFISCLGLFGLSSFSAEQRTKEMGVRKIMGASVTQLVVLLTSDFMKQVLIAVAIATPVAWWIMSQWLQGFVYRIHIPYWIFVAVGCLACVIALATVGGQAIRVTTANPVKAIKAE